MIVSRALCVEVVLGHGLVPVSHHYPLSTCENTDMCVPSNPPKGVPTAAGRYFEGDRVIEQYGQRHEIK